MLITDAVDQVVGGRIVENFWEGRIDGSKYRNRSIGFEDCSGVGGRWRFRNRGVLKGNASGNGRRGYGLCFCDLHFFDWRRRRNER